LKKPVHVLQLGSTVRNIANMAVIAVVDAQIKGQGAPEVLVEKSPWWKRSRRKNESNGM
jgi:malate dehydrogenase (oxaloacetate-decarboxylating)(NADP+)